MKKLLSVIIAFVLATFAFTGCSMKNNTDNENPAPSADGRVKDNRNLTPAEYTMMNTVGTDALGRYFTEAAVIRRIRNTSVYGIRSGSVSIPNSRRLFTTTANCCLPKKVKPRSNP